MKLKMKRLSSQTVNEVLENRVNFHPSIIEDAELIVDKCMGFEEAFCQSSCPMRCDAKGYVNLIGERKYDEAIKLIRETLFLPNTLGRVCAHPCEKACRRGTDFNEPIAIAALKRFAAEKADKEAIWDLRREAATGKKVAVVGSGPAGVQAAIDLAKKGHSVTIYDKLEKPGGMLRVGIPAYRLPREVLDFEYRYPEKLGIKFLMGVVIGKDISFERLREQYDAVLLAHGAHLGNRIPIEGKDAKGVLLAVDYLREISLFGGSVEAGNRIMVIGGGDVAMDSARSAFRIGASKVYQCSLESLSEMPASPEEIEEAVEEGLDLSPGHGPVKILKDKDGHVKGIVIQKVKKILKNGRPSFEFYGAMRTIRVDTVIMATGQVVQDITDGTLVQTRGGRYVVDKKTLQSTEEDVFVAGDAAGGHIVVEAMALGQKAAESIHRYISEIDLHVGRDFSKEGTHPTKLDIPLPKGTTDRPRLHTRLRPPKERKLDFDQADLGFDELTAVNESSRCLTCECKLCMQECVMMNDFGEAPKELMIPLVETGYMDPSLAYSCNGCDNCTIVCPHQLPMKRIFMDSRKDFVVANGGESPMEGHKVINMHQKLGFSKLFTMKKEGKRDA